MGGGNVNRIAEYVDATGTVDLAPFGNVKYTRRVKRPVDESRRAERRCHVCERVVRITLDGRLYRHGHNFEVDLKGRQGTASTPCEGTGQEAENGEDN